MEVTELNRVKQQAIRFAERTSSDMIKCINTSVLSAPKQDDPTADAITNLYFQALLDLIPALAWSFTRDLSPNVESQVMTSLSGAFERLRKQHGGTGENGKQSGPRDTSPAN